MGIWLGRITKICCGVATVVAFGAQVGPADAVSNLSAWFRLLGIEQIPRWLSSATTDIYATYISMAVIMVCLIVLGYPRLKKLREKPVSKIDQGHFAVEINTTTPVNQAAEPWFEWLHVQAAPPPGASPENLIASSNLDNRVHDMRWRSDRGPMEEIIARAERPAILPVVLRSQRDEVVMGTPVRGGVCYLTEINFQVHHIAIMTVNAGVHQLFIMVRTRDNRDAMREFRLIVPPILNEPLRLEPI